MLELELKRNLPDIFRIEVEYPLNQQPLLVDALVVAIDDVDRVPRDYNLARIYSRYNVHEFKSPGESLNVIAYNKGLAYAHLFMDIKMVDGKNSKQRYLRSDEMTVTFICARNPVKLIKHLNDNRKLRVDYADGIYTVYGEEYAVQIAVTSKLPDNENRYLKVLTEEHATDYLHNILDDGIMENQEQDNQLVEKIFGYLDNVFGDEFWEVLFMKNTAARKKFESKTPEERLRDLKARYPDEVKWWKDVFAPEFLEDYRPSIIEQAKPTIIRNTSLNTARKLLKLNLDVESICYATGLDEATVRELE